MKILHITHGYFPENQGGTENHCRELLAEQQRQGMEVVLLAGSIEPWPECGLEEFVHEGVRVRRLHRDDWYFDNHFKAYHPGVERLVRTVITEEAPDLIHVHQWIRLTSNLLEIADDFDVPVVVTLHDLYTSCPRAFRVRRDGEPCDRKLSVESCKNCVPRYGHEPAHEINEGIRLHHAQYQSELGRARAVMVPSQATADMICKTTGFPAGQFDVLPLAYEPRYPHGAPPRPPLPADGEPFRFGYWGMVTERKGVQILLEAVRALTQRGPARPFEVHVFGRVDTEDLRRRLDELAVGQPVTFHGRYDYDQLAAARLHMAVFPIICFETFGFVLDEAVELGLPAIVTDIGALPERAGASALRVPSRDPGALTAALAEILARPALRDELAAHLPPRGPTTADHTSAITRVYLRALEAPPLAVVDPVDPLRRAAFLVTQRESALRRPPGGEPS